MGVGGSFFYAGVLGEDSHETLRDWTAGQDEGAVGALWTRAFGDAVGGQTLDWLFRSGAAGPSPRCVAEVDGKIVAHAGVTALQFCMDGQVVRGGYSVGAMTDPEYRGRGIYARLGAFLYERLEREGFAFVAGFSNAESHRLMAGPLARKVVAPFPWCVRILRPLGVAKALWARSAEASAPIVEVPIAESGRHRVAPQALDAQALDELWDRIAPAVRIGAVRDAAFARSRFATRPDAGYSAVAVEKAQGFAAWGIHRTIRIRGQLATFLVDFQVAPGEQGAGQYLLESLGRAASAQGVGLLSALLPGEGEARDSLRGSRFFRIPERLHPQLIRFSIRGLGAYADSELLANSSAWRLSWSDTDVV